MYLLLYYLSFFLFRISFNSTASSPVAWTGPFTDRDLVRISSFRILEQINASVISVGDLNGDHIDDFLCWSDSRNILIGLCGVKDSTTFNLCLNQTIEINKYKINNNNIIKLHSVIIIDFDLDGFADLLLTFQIKSSVSEVDESKKNSESEFLPSVWLSNSEYINNNYLIEIKYNELWTSNIPFRDKPFLFDANHDGYWDILVELKNKKNNNDQNSENNNLIISDTTRLVLLNNLFSNNKTEIFKFIKWIDLSPFIDTTAVSNQIAFDLDLLSVSKQPRQVWDMVNLAMAEDENEKGDENLGGSDRRWILENVKKWWKNIWGENNNNNNNNINNNKNNQINKNNLIIQNKIKGEQELKTRGKQIIKKYYLLMNNSNILNNNIKLEVDSSINFSFRPLPLKHPSTFIEHSSHQLVDINGDCIADLILTVQSPDLSETVELEIWLTEINTEGKIVWKLWAGQRLIMPDNFDSMTVNGFGSGSSDLVVLTCIKDELKQKCISEETLFMFTNFQYPLCDSTSTPTDDNLWKNCKAPNELCKMSPFAFGGMDPKYRHVGISASTIRTKQEIEQPESFSLISRLSSTYTSAAISSLDVDLDGYADITLLISSGPSTDITTDLPSFGVRIFNNVPFLTDPANTDGYADKQGQSWTPPTSFTEGFNYLVRIGKQIISAVARAFRSFKKEGRPAYEVRAFQKNIDLVTSSSNGIINAGFSPVPNSPGIFELALFPQGDSVRNSAPEIRRNPDANIWSPVLIFQQRMQDNTNNLFLRATALGLASRSLSKKSDDAGLALAGSVFTMTVTDMDSTRHERRHTLTPAGFNNELKSSSIYFGLGQSNNYIENLALGIPCAANYDSKSNEGQSLVDLCSTKWVAIIPNAEVVASVGPDRIAMSHPSKWTLELLLNPGQTVRNIIFGSVASLAIVGITVLILRRQEQDKATEESRGFRSQFLAV